MTQAGHVAIINILDVYYILYDGPYSQYKTYETFESLIISIDTPILVFESTYNQNRDCISLGN